MASSPPSERRLLGAVGAVHRDEWPFALLMFTYVFLVIGTFWILKPLKKGLFIEFYDKSGFDLAGRHFGAAEAELLAKVLNMVVAIVAVALFTWLARRFRRERLTAILMAGFVAGQLALCAVGADRRAPPTVWSFYLFGDLFSTLMVATFFAFLNDSVTPEARQAPVRLRRPRRGAGRGRREQRASGSSSSRWAPSTWLYGCAAAGVLVVAAAIAAGASRGASRRGSRRRPRRRRAATRPSKARRWSSRSPYLLSIAAIVGIYEIVSTIMDFQFTSTVAHFLDGGAIGAHLSRVFAVTNVASMLVQFFLTPLVMQQWGLGIALLVLPATTFAGSLAFLALPSLLIGSPSTPPTTPSATRSTSRPRRRSTSRRRRTRSTRRRRSSTCSCSVPPRRWPSA